MTGQARTSLRLKIAEDLGRYLTTKIAEGPGRPLKVLEDMERHQKMHKDDFKRLSQK